MWLHAGRLFHNDAKPGFHEVGSAGRVADHRVRTARGRSKNLVGAELSYALSALGPARERTLRHVCAERLPAADRVGTSGGGRRNCCSTPRAQSGSRGPAGSGTGKEAGCEEKEARGGSGWSRRGGPPGRRRAYARPQLPPPRSCPHALGPNGDGTIRDQLSLAVAIVPVRGQPPVIAFTLRRRASHRKMRRRTPQVCLSLTRSKG